MPSYTRRRLAAYLAEALDPDEAAEITERAAVDPALAKRLDKLRAVLDAEEPRPRGRPPKGRTARLQVMILPEPRAWVRAEADRLGQSEADVVEGLILNRMHLSGTPAPAGQEPDQT